MYFWCDDQFLNVLGDGLVELRFGGVEVVVGIGDRFGAGLDLSTQLGQMLRGGDLTHKKQIKQAHFH